MGDRARNRRNATQRKIRSLPLSDDERNLLLQASYEGSAFHKKEPNDFGLTPPANPHPDKTLCDEAGVFAKARAKELFDKALKRGLVSESTTGDGFPKQIWVVDGAYVFELMYGGSRAGCYHGYPIRSADPLHSQIRAAWSRT